MNKVIEKWNIFPDAVKASLAFTFSSFFIRGIGFIFTPVFTRIMSQTQYGIISTYNAWSMVIEVLAVLGMTSAGIINVGLNDYRSSRDQYLSNITIIGNVTTLLVFVLLFAINQSPNGNVILPNTLLCVMMLHFFFYPAQIYWLARQRYELKYKAATIVTIIPALVGQILAIILVVYASDNQGRLKIVANEVGYLIVAVPIYVMLLYRGKSFFDKNIWRDTFLFAIPLIPHYLSQHLMSSADRIMISNMISTSDTAIYNLVYNIGWLATLVWTAINASLTPFIFEKLNTKSYQSVKNVTKTLIIFYSLICLTAVILAPEAIRILAPKEYYVGVYSIPPIVAVSFMNCFYNLYANVEFYHKKTKYIAGATIVSAIINIFLNYLMISKWSYTGAAYATLLSYTLMVILHYKGYRKSQAESIYYDAFFVKWTIGIIVICIGFSALYRNDLIRYSFLGVCIIMVMIKSRFLRGILAEAWNNLKQG